jgi:hypothetical protein
VSFKREVLSRVKGIKDPLLFLPKLLYEFAVIDFVVTQRLNLGCCGLVRRALVAVEEALKIHVDLPYRFYRLSHRLFIKHCKLHLVK